MSDRIDSSYVTSARQEESQEIKQEVMFANMEVSQESMFEIITTGENIRFRDLQSKLPLKIKTRRHTVKKTGAFTEDKTGTDIGKTSLSKDTAARYHANNEELEEDSLMALQEYIKHDDDAEKVIEKVKYFYKDMSLADSALDFLLEVFDGPAREQILLAKERINALHGREISAGKNISKESQLFSNRGIGSAVFLRKMYVDVTGNPKPAPELFDELSSKFPYQQMKVLLKFFLKSLGADLRSKGPSIAKGELWQLVTETRVMQSILGVFRFFQSRMGLVDRQFFKNDLDKPPGMNFEELAKSFMQLANDKFPSPDKIRSILTRLGLGRTILGKLIVGLQFRDAVREVDGQKIFGRAGIEPSAISAHMHELWQAIIDLLNDLEDEYEDELEEKLKEDKEHKKDQQKHKDSQEDGQDDDEDEHFVSSLKDFLDL